MTREEKIALLNTLLEMEEKEDIGNLTRSDRAEFQMWVKALEQEPKTDVLGEIKAEIMSLDYIDEDDYEGTIIDPKIDRGEVLEIIDKYRERLTQRQPKASEHGEDR